MGWMIPQWNQQRLEITNVIDLQISPSHIRPEATLQTCHPLPEAYWRYVNTLLAARHDIKVRIYPNKILSIDFVRFLPELRRFMIDIDTLKTLEDLIHTPHLRDLDLTTEKVDISGLRHCPELESLSASAPKNARILNQLENLQEIFLGKIKLTQKLDLRACKKLQIQGSGLFPNIYKVEELALNVCGKLEKVEERLTKQHSLKALGLYSNRYMEDISWVTRIPNLRILDLFRIKAQSDLSFLRDYSSLKVLSCPESKVDPDAYLWINDSNIERLVVSKERYVKKLRPYIHNAEVITYDAWHKRFPHESPRNRSVRWPAEIVSAKGTKASESEKEQEQEVIKNELVSAEIDPFSLLKHKDGVWSLIRTDYKL